MYSQLKEPRIRTIYDAVNACEDEDVLKELFEPAGRLLFRKVTEAVLGGVMQVERSQN